jgi:hypothetical protein
MRQKSTYAGVNDNRNESVLWFDRSRAHSASSRPFPRRWSRTADGRARWGQFISTSFDIVLRQPLDERQAITDDQRPPAHSVGRLSSAEPQIASPVPGLGARRDVRTATTPSRCRATLSRLACRRYGLG